MHSRPDNGAQDLYALSPNTEWMFATLSTPEAATTRNTANTCGSPQTIWLFIPVIAWPSTSIACAATSPVSTSSAPHAASSQNERAEGR